LRAAGRHHDLRAVARVPERAHERGLQPWHVGCDREHPVVGRRFERGDEPTERTLVGDLVGQHGDVRRESGVGERLGPVGDHDRVSAYRSDRLDHADEQGLTIDGQKRLVDAHAHRATAGQNGRGDRKEFTVGTRGHRTSRGPA
jgi:hypothetical protein